MTVEIINNRVLIFPHQLEDFNKRLENLNKKASKFGLPAITMQSSKDSFWKYESEAVGEDGNTFMWLAPANERDMAEMLHPVRLTSIELEYPIIKLGDWHVIGKLEAVDGGNMQFSVTKDTADQHTLSAAAEQPICCEHCGTNRKRKDSFLLKSEASGEYKQVGTSCLEDFTGIDPAAALFLAQMSHFIKACEEDRDGEFRTGKPREINTNVYLAVVSHMADKNGFISRRLADERGTTATADDAIFALLSQKAPDYSDHLEKAKSIREWAKTLEGNESFIANLRLLMANDSIKIDNKHLGIAAAAVPQYNRHLNQEHTKATSDHVGAPGDKIKCTLTVQGTHTFDTVYGPSTFVTLADANGNVLKWKTASCPDEIRRGRGRSFEGQFKVKEHADYKGTKQTNITHLKVLSWLDNELEQAAEQESTSVEDHQLFYVVKRLDAAAIDDWPGFVTPTYTDSMPILKAYAEDACASGEQAKHDLFSDKLFISPHDFYMNYGLLADLHSQYAAQREQDSLRQAAQASPDLSTPEPAHAQDDSSPTPF